MVPISHHPTTYRFYDTSSRERGADTAPAFQGIEQQLLRILRCTAQAMVSTRGGLVFSPGARPWLEGLVQNHPGGSIDYRVTPRLALPVERLDDSLDVEPPAFDQGLPAPGRQGARPAGLGS